MCHAFVNITVRACVSIIFAFAVSLSCLWMVYPHHVFENFRLRGNVDGSFPEEDRRDMMDFYRNSKTSRSHEEHILTELIQYQDRFREAMEMNRGQAGFQEYFIIRNEGIFYDRFLANKLKYWDCNEEWKGTYGVKLYCTPLQKDNVGEGQ